MVAIPAQRDQIREPVVGRVEVDVVDVERHVRAAAVGAAPAVGGKDAGSQLLQLPAAWSTGSVVATVATLGERAAA